VYVNDVYQILSPDVPITIATDTTGTVTIIQETQGVGAVGYRLRLKSDGTEIDVNPMIKLIDIVAGIQNGNDLSNITIANVDGSTRKLVPNGIARQDVDSTVLALQQFSRISARMPPDGSRKSVRAGWKRSLSHVPAAPVVQSDSIWGLSYGPEGITPFAGAEAMAHYGLQRDATGTLMTVSTSTIQLDDMWDAIEIAAGDMFRWIKHAVDAVAGFFVTVVGEVCHFFIELGGQLYRFVLDCVSDVVNAIEFVLNKIKIFIQDLIKQRDEGLGGKLHVDRFRAWRRGICPDHCRSGLPAGCQEHHGNDWQLHPECQPHDNTLHEYRNHPGSLCRQNGADLLLWRESGSSCC